MVSKQSGGLRGRIKEQRERRKIRSKSAVISSSDRLRMIVTRTNRSFVVQIVNHDGTVAVACSSIEKDLRGKIHMNVEGAKLIGETIGRRAVDKGITRVVFDRCGALYHGRVKALADAARGAGLDF